MHAQAGSGPCMVQLALLIHFRTPPHPAAAALRASSAPAAWTPMSGPGGAPAAAPAGRAAQVSSVALGSKPSGCLRRQKCAPLLQPLPSAGLLAALASWDCVSRGPLALL